MQAQADPIARQTEPVKADAYRPDIDGMRALSVLAVFAFHLGVDRLPGGFVGVDVFFVISGFLIGGLVNGQMARGTFTYANFYERRIRRIFPALAVVLAATTIAAAFLLYPSAMRDYAASLAAAALSYSNIYFWLSTNYFADAATSQPLLHTWSLSVEEQFYILLPPFLGLMHWKMPRHVFSVVLFVTVLSFAVSVWGAYEARTPTFYLPFTRAWELLLGVLVAIRPVRQLDNKLLRNIVAGLGLALIVFAMLTLQSRLPFPGLNAAPVCLGAAMVIAAGARGSSVAGSVLSLAPFTAIGKISYSLYLWHWPIIVLWKGAKLGETLSRIDQAAIVVIAFALSYLSWRFVEQPARNPGSRRPLVLGLAGGACGVLVAAAIAVVSLGGLPGRFSPEVTRVTATLDYDPSEAFRTGQCFLDLEQGLEQFDRATCLATEPGKKAYLLLGDSRAADLYHGLTHVLPDGHLMQATASGCHPFAMAGFSPERWCGPLMRFMFEDYLPNNPPDLLILTAEWTREDVGPLSDTLAWARGMKIPVVVIGPTIEYAEPLPSLLAAGLRRGDPGLADRHVLEEAKLADPILRKTVEALGVRYVSVIDAICDDGVCPGYSPDGQPFYFDEDHFTHDAAHLVAEQLVETGAFTTSDLRPAR